MGVVLSALLSVLLALASYSYAQTVPEDLAADEDGNLVGPRPPDYQVDENGLIIGGEIRIRGSDIGRPPDPSELRRATPGAKAQIERTRSEQIRTSRAAGLDAAGDPHAGASSPPGVSADGDGTLPEIGGHAFPTPLLPGATLLLPAGGPPALRATR